VPHAPFVRVPSEECESVYATLVSAFTHDPVERWMYPTDKSYDEHFPKFLEAFGGGAFAAGTVWGLADLSAVALWLPPGVEADGDAIVSVLRASVAPNKQADAFAVIDQMADAHPTYPHWYLPWLGVNQACRGIGLGTQLLSACLEFVDADRLPAYLETPDPRTLSFYHRHGFELVGEAQAGACPPLSFLLRPAR
jgi:ribosomal protein S18 acetylase RimI-like enzyme